MRREDRQLHTTDSASKEPHTLTKDTMTTSQVNEELLFNAIRGERGRIEDIIHSLKRHDWAQPQTQWNEALETLQRMIHNKSRDYAFTNII